MGKNRSGVKQANSNNEKAKANKVNNRAEATTSNEESIGDFGDIRTKEYLDKTSFLYEERYLDALASLFAVQDPVTAVICSNNVFYISYNSAPTVSTTQSVETIETTLNKLFQSDAIEPEHLITIKKDLLELYLKYNIETRLHFRKSMEFFSKDIDPERTILTQIVEKPSDKDDPYKNYNCYLELLKGLTSKALNAGSASEAIEKPNNKTPLSSQSFVEGLLRPLQDVEKLVWQLLEMKKNGLDGIKIELLDNKRALHAEMSINSEFPFFKGYMGVSILCCAGCDKALTKAQILHRGTHGKWEISKWEEPFKEYGGIIKKALSEDAIWMSFIQLKWLEKLTPMLITKVQRYKAIAVKTSNSLTPELENILKTINDLKPIVRKLFDSDDINLIPRLHSVLHTKLSIPCNAFVEGCNDGNKQLEALFSEISKMVPESTIAIQKVKEKLFSLKKALEVKGSEAKKQLQQAALKDQELIKLVHPMSYKDDEYENDIKGDDKELIDRLTKNGVNGKSTRKLSVDNFEDQIFWVGDPNQSLLKLKTDLMVILPESLGYIRDQAPEVDSEYGYSYSPPVSMEQLLLNEKQKLLLTKVSEGEKKIDFGTMSNSEIQRMLLYSVRFEMQDAVHILIRNMTIEDIRITLHDAFKEHDQLAVRDLMSEVPSCIIGNLVEDISGLD